MKPEVANVLAVRSRLGRTSSVGITLTLLLLVAAVTIAVPKPTAAATNPASAVVTWAESFYLHTDTHPNQYDGSCLAFVEAAYGSAGISMTAVGDSNGAAQYWHNQAVGSNPDHLVVKPNDTNPPVGALLFWDATTSSTPGVYYDNPYGHVAIYIGGNQVISTAAWPYKQGNNVQEFTFTGPGSRNAQGYPYLGWAAPASMIAAQPNGPTAPTYPAEGSFVQVPNTPQVYEIVGGAPVAATSWAAVGYKSRPINVQGLTQAQFNRIHPHLLDGTFIRGHSTGQIYRMTGGAPTYVSGTGWRAGGLSKGARLIEVDQAAIDHAGQPGVWTHILNRPVNGAIVKSGAKGRYYRFDGGAPYLLVNWDTVNGRKPFTVIDAANVGHAGQPGVWTHVAKPVSLSCPQRCGAFVGSYVAHTSGMSIDANGVGEYGGHAGLYPVPVSFDVRFQLATVHRNSATSWSATGAVISVKTENWGPNPPQVHYGTLTWTNGYVTGSLFDGYAFCSDAARKAGYYCGA